MRTSVTTALLNPCRVTVTEYVPGSKAGTLKAPVELVTVLNLVPFGLVTTTAAPGMTPPAES